MTTPTISPRTPRILLVLSELRGDGRVSSLIPLLPLSFILFIELTRKHKVRLNFHRTADLSVPGMSNRDYPLSLSGKSRTHLRQISISNKNLRTKHQRDVDSVEIYGRFVVTLYGPSRPIWLRTFIKLDLIILSTSSISYPQS